jgi:hypothetical protein
LEDLPKLWEQADLGERRRILLTMLDAVYVDPVEAKSIVAIKPKPAFHALFEISTTREDSEVALVKEEPPGDGQEAPCLWWRRGRVELPLKQQLVVWVLPDWEVTRASLVAQ